MQPLGRRDEIPRRHNGEERARQFRFHFNLPGDVTKRRYQNYIGNIDVKGNFYSFVEFIFTPYPGHGAQRSRGGAMRR
jgi:hypothetical protein